MSPTPDRDDRISHAAETLTELFPNRTVTAAAGHSAGAREFAVLPSVRHPRLLVPLSPRSAPAAALRAYGGRLSRRDQVAYAGLAAGLGVTGSRVLRRRFTVADAAGTATPAPGIDDHLGALVGEAVSVAIHLTPARANRKPIVQALAPKGRYPVAFAKVATNALTGGLISAETVALATLDGAGLTSFVVPEVLGSDPFDARPTLVMRPLATWAGGRLPTRAELAAASAELADIGDQRRIAVRESTFWHRLRSDIELVPDLTKRDALRAAADGVDAAFGDTEIETGAAHGDWSPWNMWRTTAGLLVWDWERFATDSPVGADQVHYRLQELLVVAGNRPIDAAREALGSAADHVTAVLHLLTLAVRYDKDEQRARPTGEWLIPVINEATRATNSTAGQT